MIITPYTKICFIAIHFFCMKIQLEIIAIPSIKTAMTMHNLHLLEKQNFFSGS